MLASRTNRNSGAAVAVLLALGTTGALAMTVASAGETADWGDVVESRAGAGPIDPDTLVRFEDSDYRLAYDPSVSTEPTARAQVRKIAFGRVSTVDITTTSTGTYSSEALFSPHVLYPGIAVERVASDVSEHHPTGRRPFALPDAGSFVSIGRTATSTVVVTSGIACVATASLLIC